MLEVKCEVGNSEVCTIYHPFAETLINEGFAARYMSDMHNSLILWQRL